MAKAISRSTDTFFYKLGEAVGIETLVEWMKKFGLTKLTEIDINGEVQSLVPSPDWKEKVKKEKWFLGNTYHFSIGQGDLALSPVGIHRADLTVVNNGKLCSLKIVGSTKCIDLTAKPGILIKKDNLDYVKEGMKMACSIGGTAFTFFDFSMKHNNLEVICKTGTAETDEIDKTHAWFFASAPMNDPELVLTVMVESGGEGSKVAGPIAREIFDYYFAIEAQKE